MSTFPPGITLQPLVHIRHLAAALTKPKAIHFLESALEESHKCKVHPRQVMSCLKCPFLLTSAASGRYTSLEDAPYLLFS